MRPTRSFSHIGEDALYHVAEDIKQAMLELAYMTKEIDSMNFEQLRRKIDAIFSHAVETYGEQSLSHYYRHLFHILYFENRMDLYENMPDNLICKLLKRKNVIDFMDFTPACLSLIAVVSNKIKRILEHLDVSRNEYVLKRITVKDFSDDFYLLFLPIIPDTEFVYPRCVFEDMYDS